MSLPPMLAAFDQRVVRNDYLSASVTDTGGGVFVPANPGPSAITAITPNVVDPRGSWANYTITGTAFDTVTRVIFRKSGQYDRIGGNLTNKTSTSLQVSSNDELAASGGWDVILEGPNGTKQSTLKNGVTVEGAWVEFYEPSVVQDSLSNRQYTFDGVGLDAVNDVEFYGGSTIYGSAVVNSSTDTKVVASLPTLLAAGVYPMRLQPGAISAGSLTVKDVPVEVTSIAPSTVASAASAVEYVITGSGLDKTNWVEFFNATTGVRATGGQPVPNPGTNTEVRYTATVVLAPGVYDLVLSATQNFLRVEDALTVT